MVDLGHVSLVGAETWIQIGREPSRCGRTFQAERKTTSKKTKIGGCRWNTMRKEEKDNR